MKIPFNISTSLGNEYKYMKRAVENSHISGDGEFTKLCSKYFEESLGVKKALLTTSCTHALEMTALLLDLKPDDEVIIPSFTFVSTVNAFVLRGAKPILIDIRPDTLNMDENQLERLITSRTKAIVLVNYAGVGCEIDMILDIANKYNIAVVEDNAHGLFGKYKGKLLGTFGTFGTQSFHETKNFSCGEGGALLINDDKYIERAEIIREKGTNRSQFFRGQIDKYTWVDVGSSYLPSDILAAFLLAQLESREKIQSKRKKIWDTYNKSLEDWSSLFDVQLPNIPSHCNQAYHMFYMLMPSLNKRDNFIKYLRKKDIEGVFHYLPLHLSRMGKIYGYKKGDYPVTEDISRRLVRLPFYYSFSLREQAYVNEMILSYTL